jgi:hypothetical protein
MPDSFVNRHPVIRSAYLLAGLAIAAPSSADSGYINIEIVNNGTDDQRVSLVDNLCEDLVLEKRILAHGILPASVCSRDMGRGDVTIRNLETGAEQRHRGIHSGAQIGMP